MSDGARKVLHLIDTGGPGGAETIFLDLVLGLEERGWESIPVLPERDWLHRKISSAGLDIVELRATRAFDVPYLLALRDRIRRLHIDLVQTHLLGTSVYGALACLGLGVPVVSTFHGRPDIQPQDRLRPLKTRVLGLPGNRVVCVSQSLKDYFVDRGYLSDQTRVIPNGVDIGGLDRGTSTDPRGRLGLPPDVPVVGAVGNVRASKGYDRLIEAFSDVVSECPSARLVIAGQCAGPLGDTLMELRSRLGLDEAVHFLGFRDNVGEVLESLDVFVLSSLDEGFSLATVQAMAVGLPVVATRSGGPEEIVGDSGAALLVPAGDARALADPIIRLLRHPDEAATLGARARRHVADRYSVDSMVDGYEALYLELLGE